MTLGSRNMNRYDSEWWSVDLPDDWRTERDDTCTSMFSKSGVGALQISAVRNNDGPATDDDLKDFAKAHLDAGAPVKPVNYGAFMGFYLHYSLDNFYQRQWWLRCADTVVLATYTSDLEDKGIEDGVVDNILKTLQRK